MKRITKAVVAITFSLALIMPVAASANSQDDKKEKTEQVKKECKETKACAEKSEKKCCDKKATCSGDKK